MINGEVNEAIPKNKWPSSIPHNNSRPGNVKAIIYGAQHPPLAHLTPKSAITGLQASKFFPPKPGKTVEKSSSFNSNKLSLHSGFPDFKKSTDDAWDIIDINECYENMDRQSPQDSRNRHHHHTSSRCVSASAYGCNKGGAIQQHNTNFEVIPRCHVTGVTISPCQTEICRDLFDKKLSINPDVDRKKPVPSTTSPLYPSLAANIQPTFEKVPRGPGVGKRCSSSNSAKDHHHPTHANHPSPNKGGAGLYGSRHTSCPEDCGTGSRNYYKTAADILRSEQEMVRMEKFSRLMNAEKLDIDELTRLSWSGIPPKYRPLTWKILSHYIPACHERRKETLERKRKEYFAFVEKYYPSRYEDVHKDMYRQIHIDIPRMNPLIDLFQQPTVQNMFERILYIWAMRHPASGYVQGINDLVTPFFVVFLSEYVPAGTSVDSFSVDSLPQDILSSLEADSFWCVSNLLDGIQDNYTFAQPGIQEKVNLLKHLVSRINVPLFNHLRANEVEYLQFAFRWMNNLLMREIPLKCTIRLWDTYLAEPNGFSHFHLYVCVAFVNDWSDEILRERDFQGIMLLVQNLPTKQWGEKEIGLLVAEAFKLKYIFADAPRHLKPAQEFPPDTRSSNEPRYPDRGSSTTTKTKNNAIC